MPALDPRLHAYRDDLADSALRGRVAAARYVDGRPARVVSGHAAMRRSPEPTAPVDTFCLYGEPVRVFDDDAGWAWCQAEYDLYVGYLETGHLATGDARAPTHHVMPLGAYRYAIPDLRTTPLDLLPRHAAVIVAETGLVTRGTEYARLDPAGFLPLACLSAAPPRSRDLVAAASLYLGCPYLWGGRSALGLDCSGLVQQGFRDLGIRVPRDTDQQQGAIGAAVAASGMHDLVPGDLIFIPGHVMIYAGDGVVIHASGATMTVRRDNLAELARDWGIEFAGLVVRRYQPGGN
ncbi:MAG TPA: C40 family peptidase [Stellaceae bacterium]|nr:C40 family peptidase [Stellaceae bacterium]